MKFCLRITVKIPSNRIMPVSVLNMRNLGVLLVLVDIVGKLCKTDILISSTLPRPGLPEPVWGQPSTHKHWRKRKSSHCAMVHYGKWIYIACIFCKINLLWNVYQFPNNKPLVRIFIQVWRWLLLCYWVITSSDW